jgi:cholesterol oxidase
MRQLGERMGVADSFRPAEVGVFFGEAGEVSDDPFFGGAGPDRTGCIGCGGCMVGCRHDSKNSLDRNYLYLAEQAGASVLPERQVTAVRPLPEGGYEVVSERPGPVRGRAVRYHRVEQVVFSAGVLGTVRLLADMKERGSLPHLSSRLGELTRTNSESIPGASSARGSDVDYSTGIAISSSIYPDNHTHIEGVRYPAGSNAMALLATVLVDGGGRVPRQVRFLGQVLRHPGRFLASLSVRRWSERTVILLVMQSHDNSINLRWRRRRRGVRLRSEQGTGEPNPTFIPEASEAARQAADIMGGDAFGSLNEALLDVPVTAHILGGCVIGTDADHGVIDAYHRVFGHPGLHIADGSTISANLGVNPSLTITAQAERAMALWPNRGEPDQRPPLGAAYERVQSTSPRSPTVPADAPAALSW